MFFGFALARVQTTILIKNMGQNVNDASQAATLAEHWPAQTALAHQETGRPANSHTHANSATVPRQPAPTSPPGSPGSSTTTTSTTTSTSSTSSTNGSPPPTPRQTSSHQRNGQPTRSPKHTRNKENDHQQRSRYETSHANPWPHRLARHTPNTHCDICHTTPVHTRQCESSIALQPGTNPRSTNGARNNPSMDTMALVATDALTTALGNANLAKRWMARPRNSIPSRRVATTVGNNWSYRGRPGRPASSHAPPSTLIRTTGRASKTFGAPGGTFSGPAGTHSQPLGTRHCGHVGTTTRPNTQTNRAVHALASQHWPICAWTAPTPAHKFSQLCDAPERVPPPAHLASQRTHCGLFWMMKPPQPSSSKCANI